MVVSYDLNYPSMFNRAPTHVYMVRFEARVIKLCTLTISHPYFCPRPTYCVTTECWLRVSHWQFHLYWGIIDIFHGGGGGGGDSSFLQSEEERMNEFRYWCPLWWYWRISFFLSAHTIPPDVTFLSACVCWHISPSCLWTSTWFVSPGEWSGKAWAAWYRCCAICWICQRRFRWLCSFYLYIQGNTSTSPLARVIAHWFHCLQFPSGTISLIGREKCLL